MTLWFFRLTVNILSPVIGWYKVSSDWKGIAAGVAAALFVIGVEILPSGPHVCQTGATEPAHLNDDIFAHPADSRHALAVGIPFGFFQSALSTDARSSALHSEGRL